MLIPHANASRLSFLRIPPTHPSCPSSCSPLPLLCSPLCAEAQRLLEESLAISGAGAPQGDAAVAEATFYCLLIRLAGIKDDAHEASVLTEALMDALSSMKASPGLSICVCLRRSVIKCGIGVCGYEVSRGKCWG